MIVTTNASGAIGAALERKDGPLKVRGTANHADEWPLPNPAYLYPLQSSIAVGRIAAVDATAALAEPGVLAVLTHLDAPRLAWSTHPEIAVLQSDEVAFRGQLVGAVIAETLEIARHAAGLVEIEYEQRPHDVDLRADRDDLHRPRHAATCGMMHGDLQDGSPADSAVGDFDAGLAAAAVTVDATYTTPMRHHNPMEPHAAVATWTGDEATVYCSSQGVHDTRGALARAFGIDAARIRLISPHVGGGSGSKAFPASYATLALMGARLVPGRSVKFTLTRQQMFAFVGYRPATIQRVRLGADADGRLTAIAHDAVQQTARAKEYAEQIVGSTRAMYAAPHRRTTTRVAALDVAVPTIMRGPGEATGMYAIESAMDELACALGVDPVELRVRNEPHTHPESGLPFSSRHLVTCLREGARRFGWEGRDPAVRARREAGWLVGTGVAASIHPAPSLPGGSATMRAGADGRYTVRIGVADIDIGTGAWTALTQIAAEALGVAVADVTMEIGDTGPPGASRAGCSSGISSWGTTIYAAADLLLAVIDGEHGGTVPPDGVEVSADMPDNPYVAQYAMYSFGAQFAEVRVREDTGEVRVPRLLGVFDAGRIINPRTARSQLVGDMTQGLSMALHEASVIDPRFGHVVNNDLGAYHFAANADVGSIEVHWIDEKDPYTNPMGSKGVGELCIVGTAAAIANAVHHATGIRVRDLPITLDKLLT